MTTKTPDYASKIAALLAKAEDPAATPAEAETYSAKAEALMVKWGISDAELDAKKRGQRKAGEKIIEKVIHLDGPNARGLLSLAFGVGAGLGVRVLKSASRRSSMAQDLYLIGFESDVARAEALFSSLTLQATAAREVWWTAEDKTGMSGNDKFLARRQFLTSFGQVVAVRLAETRRSAEAEVKETGTALVLVDRQQRVDDDLAVRYPKLAKAKGTRGSYHGAAAGAAAGRQANLGGTQVGTGKAGAIAS